MDTKPFNLGSTIIVEVEFKKQTPFGTLVYFDPNDFPGIVVKDPAGTAKVTLSNLTKSATGKWYYYVQTATTWLIGLYEVTITSTDGTYTDITKSIPFRLIS